MLRFGNDKVLTPSVVFFDEDEVRVGWEACTRPSKRPIKLPSM